MIVDLRLQWRTGWLGGSVVAVWRVRGEGGRVGRGYAPALGGWFVYRPRMLPLSRVRLERHVLRAPGG